MGRPPFQLTDDQARSVARGVAELDARFPVDPRSHRPFVRAFIELIRDVTGNLYSPTIYRRLFDAYASNRRPSTKTIAAERERAGAVLKRRDVSAGMPAVSTPGTPDDLASAVHEAVAEALDRHLLGMQRMTEQVNAAQVEFYQHQLTQAEAKLARLRSELTQANTELAAARQAAQQYKGEVEAARVTIGKNADTIDALSRSNDDMRKFALLAIEQSRGESRVWKERCADLEEQRQKDAQLLDSLRRQAFATPNKPFR